MEKVFECHIQQYLRYIMSVSFFWEQIEDLE